MRKSLLKFIMEDLKQCLQTMNERDHFITQMNNDLKNPLYVILGSLDLLEKEAQTQVQIDFIKRAKNNGEILMNMMNNILIDYKI